MLEEERKERRRLRFSASVNEKPSTIQAAQVLVGVRKGKKRKDYAFLHQFHDEPSYTGLPRRS